MEKMVVIFRKLKDGKHIIALFPNEVNDSTGGCTSYQHIGQHSVANYYHCVSISTPASPYEYRDLKLELERIGYSLEVKQRFNKR